MSDFVLALVIIAGGSLLALGYSLVRARWIYKQPVENKTLKRISGYISEGAMTFLMECGWQPHPTPELPMQPRVGLFRL